MSKTFDEIFDNLTLRVTSEVPASNYRVQVEDRDGVKQDVKEFFSNLGNQVLKDPKARAAWNKRVAEL